VRQNDPGGQPSRGEGLWCIELALSGRGLAGGVTGDVMDSRSTGCAGEPDFWLRRAIAGRLALRGLSIVALTFAASGLEAASMLPFGLMLLALMHFHHAGRHQVILGGNEDQTNSASE